MIALLDADHGRAVIELAHDLAAALDTDMAVASGSPPHITLATYSGISRPAATRAVAPVAARVAPFTVRAHGYGIFTGDTARDLSLHVMVVRSAPLDELHRRVHRALTAAGAGVEGITRPSVWTPHITVLDRHLTPSLLGRAVEVLAHRPHRSWAVRVDAIAVAGRGERAGARERVLALGLRPACGAG